MRKLQDSTSHGCFDEWNEVKKSTEKRFNDLPFFKERDIFYSRLGKNIGYEQNGKNEEFVRPVVVVKKFNNRLFIGLPLTSIVKAGEYYIDVSFQDSQNKNKIRNNSVILSQIRIFDSKRLTRKIGMVSKEDFERIRGRLVKFFMGKGQETQSRSRRNFVNTF